ncbi:CASP-like protein 1B2 [Ipomoea triloba]|uniref:CASP-like protein 1B2 n=1 Tax=Ipomoea triloba TaxID=35885 RepID=UPI00125D88FE|nr:CASP-like protein 1B2 [Ipomoea triloba]GMD06274.1 CASP-like protein 1B2 [Ipomoea batatas]
MAQENGNGNGVEKATQKPRDHWGIAGLVVRVLALFGTVSATVVMAMNKEKKTIVVATIGTTPIQATLTAKFQHTPAFVFFVIANGLGSLHNLLMLVTEVIGPKYDFKFKGIRLLLVALLDTVNVALVSGGMSAAAFMGQLGRDGNSHARWSRICDKFNTFCDHGTGAIIASFIALLLMIITTLITLIKLRNHSTSTLT